MNEDPAYLASLGVDVNLLQQFIELAYTFDPNSAGNYSPEFIQFVRILFGLDDFIDTNIPAPGGNGNGMDGGAPPVDGGGVGGGGSPFGDTSGGGTSPFGQFG